MDENTNHPQSLKVRFIVIGAALLIVVSVLIIIFFLLTGRSPLPISAIPSPTPVQSEQSLSRHSTIAPENVERVLNKIVKNIHWLNNNELAYSYYDNRTLQTIVAKTNQEDETVLSSTVRIKFAEFYWANANTLLIHELTSPSKAYLLTSNNTMENLNIRGLAYSWAPDSKQFFYVNRGDGSQFLPSLYSLETNSSSPEALPSLDFTHSSWSPSGEQILLYTKGFDTHDANPNILNRRNNELLPLNADEFHAPAWSPSGEKLAYISDRGLTIRNKTGGETLYYQTLSPQTVTFTWINDQELFLIDATNRPTKQLILSLQLRKTASIFTNLSLATDQRIEIALSPDRKTLALATEKNGLLFLALP